MAIQSDLDGPIDERELDLLRKIEALVKVRDELKADNERLREALKGLLACVGKREVAAAEAALKR